MKSLFLYDPTDLGSGTEGGVQLCSKEFLDIVCATSQDVEMFEVSINRQPAQRVKRKLRLGAYQLYCPSEYASGLRRVIESRGIDTVFINRAELIRFASTLKEETPHVKVILMSHGNQTGDDLYEVSGQGGNRSSGLHRKVSIWELGRDLVFESEFRHRYVDAVCVMSREEEVLERWLGASATAVLPRLIHPSPLEWEPVRGRVGFVGTLNHTPNQVALEDIFSALSEFGASEVEVRLVGRPVELGKAFEDRYPFVTYLGGLSDEELQTEAATWSLFLNPVMWLSRGASMKLGQGLAWGLPVLTTQSGRRGYEWEQGDVRTTTDDAPEFSRVMLDSLRSERTVRDLREESRRAADSAPSVSELASRVVRLREKLGDVDVSRGRSSTG